MDSLPGILSVDLRRTTLYINVRHNLGKIDRKYYKWKDSESDFKIKLGQRKSDLLSSNLINEIVANEELEYQGENGCPWRVHFKDDKVEQIWFNSNCKVDIKGFDLSEREMKVGVEFLNSNFEEISKLNKKEINLAEYDKSDVLYVIYSDFFVRMIALIKKT